jgi:hypothetical protein
MLDMVVVAESNGSGRGIGSQGNERSEDKVDFGHHEDAQKIVDWVGEEGLLIFVVLTVGDPMKDSCRMRKDYDYLKDKLKQKALIPKNHTNAAPTIIPIFYTNINIPLVDF